MSIHVLAVKDSGWMLSARSSSGNCCVLCLAFKDDHKAECYCVSFCFSAGLLITRALQRVLLPTVSVIPAPFNVVIGIIRLYIVE